MKKIFLLCLLLLSSYLTTWGQSTVTDFNSLNSAISIANSFAGDYTITFNNDITFDMSHTPIALPTWVRPINKPTGKLIIIGNNYKLEKFTGGSAGRILEIQSGSIVEIINLTITGADGSSINGGGVFNNGTITLTNCTIRNNTLTGSPANGAGIYNTGFLVLRNTTVNNNTINSSSATFQGAGIYHNGLNLLMEYSTVSSNRFLGSASFQGGGLYLGNANFVLDNVTVVRNTNATAGGGFFSAVTGGTIRNSLFLGNFVGTSTPDDINYNGGSGTAAIGSGNNLTEAIQATTIAPLFTTLNTIITPVTDIIDINLRNNGGVTQTHALVANPANVAIEGGTALGYSKDQRGDDILLTPDIGAYEFGTFWVTDNSGFNTLTPNTLSKSLRDANFSFSNAPQDALNSINKQIKFNIPSPNNVIDLFFNPILKLPITIDATTQTNYATQPNQRVKWTRGTGNAGIALHINATATGSKVFGLIMGVPSPVTARFLTGIKISANDVQIGKLTTLPTFDGLNVFQGCTNGIVVNGSNAAIHRNFFGLNTDGTDGGADNYSQGYDIVVGDSVALANTVIGVFGSGNVLAAKNGGISFTTLPALASISTTNIRFNKIGEALDRTPILGNATGMHTNGNIDGLTISSNVIVNQVNAAGIFLNDNSKNVTIAANQIGWQYNTANVPTARPCLYGIRIRGGGNSNNININNNSIAGNKPNTSAGIGIYIEAGNFADNAITIESNRIGLANNTLPLPTDAIVPNHWGIHSEGINNSSNFLTIISNIISGNDEKGIYIQSGAGVLIRNNILGLKPDDSEAPNKGTSIDMRGAGLVDNNVIAGNTNVPFSYDGIYVGSNNVMIRNNLIGLKNNAGVDIFRPNSGAGINVGAGLLSDIEISGNTISGNNEAIILMSKIGVLHNNKIGTASNGDMLTLPAGRTHANLNYGIDIRNTVATGMIISNNTISSSGVAGIKIAASGVRIENNKIGLNSAGTAAIPNNTGLEISAGLSGINIDNNSFAATQTGLLTNSPCVIQNNKFGTSHDGNLALSNFGTSATNGFSAQAILINSMPSGSTDIDNNVICGAINGNPFSVGGVSDIGTAEGITIAANNVQLTNNKIGITLTDIAIPNDIGIGTQGVINSCTIGNSGLGNIISNNRNAAIYINSAQPPSAPSFISINGNYIGMQTDVMTIPRVLSDAPTQIGIAAENNTNVGMDNNVINNTTKIGIILGNSPSPINQILNTTIGDLNPRAGFNTIAGISVGNTWTIGSSSLITNCEGVGIKIQGSFNTLYGNTIFNNGLQGINISSGNGNRIGENSIYDNGGAVTPNNPKGIDLNLSTVAIQGNDGQPAPVITSATILPMDQLAISGTASPDGTHSFYFYRTISGNADLVEGKDYIGQPPMGTVTVTGGKWSVTITTPKMLTSPLSPTDFITMTTQYNPTGSVFNTSEFSAPYLLCSTTITGITTQNSRTNCQGTLTDVRIAISTTTNIGNLFDVDINGDGTYEYTNLALQSDQTGVFVLIPDVSGATFFNTKVYDQTAACTSGGFGRNAIVIQNTALPRPSIVSARVVQPTSCINPNGQLIVKIQNGNIGQFYELSTNGVFGAEASGLVLGQDSTLRIINLSTSAVIGNLDVYQSGNQCYSQTFAFAARMTAPDRNIDTTLAVTIREDEISPNFNTVVSLAASKDSISYRLRNKTNGVFVGQAQVGNRNTLSFNTDTLQQTGSYTYEIVATDIRTGCSRVLGKTVSVQVISGILQEELDLLKEVYNSTNGNNWTVRWDFAKDISTFLGVSIFGGRVTTILLPNNNLTGTLTPRILSFKRLKSVDISRNRLDFGSVENYVVGGFVFKYDSQDKINTQMDTTAYADSQMELKVTTQGNFNTYQWQKDGQNIPNATNATLFFNALKLTDAGVYTCIIRNSRGTQLTLERRAIRVRVNQKAVSALDLTLLREFNAALGGANWKNKWIMDGSVPVAEWYGITMEGDKVKSINLANNNLAGTIPDNIPLTNNILSDLIYLNLSGNKITGTIPRSLGNLSKLQYLDISDNLLRGEVIADLSKLTNLNTLWIAKNQFTTIHPDLGKLQNLENLFAHFNLFTAIPAELGGLVALKKMNFNDNLLKNIPATIGNLENLENLSLANNILIDLPNAFTRLGRLQELYLQNNQLSALPTSFISLLSLTVFNLHTNFLDFADLEPLANLPVLNVAGAIYEPQAKIGTAQEILFTLDQKLDFTQTVNGSANTYQWFKNGVLIPNATSLQFLRNFISLADAGTYTLQIKNTIAKKLTLISRDIVVTISCGNSSSVNINVGGTSRYCEGETINTLLTANITTGVNVVGYQWLRGNAVLANETQKTLSIIQAGDYKLQVRDNNGCVFLSPVVKIEVLKKPTVSVSRVGDSLKAVVSNAFGKVSFAWYQNNNLMTAEKTQTILAKSSGLYYVVATDEQNCPSKSASINFVVTGIEDELSAKTVIYPNPSSAKITVVLPDNFVPKNIKCYNLLGQEQIIAIENNLTENTLMLNIENLTSGVYQVELVNQKGEKIRKKVIKQ